MTVEELKRTLDRRGNKNVVIMQNGELTIDYKAVKTVLHRINDRLQQFQKRKYTDSPEYNLLLEKASLIGKGVKLNTKTNRMTFSESLKGLTTNDILNAFKIGGNSAKRKGRFENYTYGTAIANAKKQLIQGGRKNPTEEDIKETMAKNAKVHDFIMNHALDIYLVNELNEAIHRPWNEKLTLKEVDDLLSMYDKKEYRDKDGNFVGNVERDSMGIPIRR